MRIISNFKDYYDSAASYGIELELIYERNTRVFPISLNRSLSHKSKRYSFPLFTYYTTPQADPTTIRGLVVGFCGKLYPAIEIIKNNAKPVYCYSLSDFISLKEETWQLRENSWIYKDNYFDLSSLSGIKRFFEYSFLEISDCFEKHHAPIFVYRTIENKFSNDLVLIVNPSLIKLDFFKIKDSASTFQEVFMFLSGVLGKKEQYLVKISDKDKIQQHGFDKWSFRKLPKS